MGDEDKQFDATPQKLERARKEGQVVKSKDVSTALSLLVMFSFINMLAPIIWKLIVGLFKTLYEQIPNQHIENALIFQAKSHFLEIHLRFLCNSQFVEQSILTVFFSYFSKGGLQIGSSSCLPPLRTTTILLFGITRIHSTSLRTITSSYSAKAEMSVSAIAFIIRSTSTFNASFVDV